ncbi:tape measure protein [Sphingobacterium sp. InxBP1]|uniref:tape measure protein n=1 Tax=Sphingobacterium sp. InxBP1 TaxID=2870328 RepID=UPI002243B3E0|nr:tape measure protein [Sphingobacterium sp. InxBP1]MCW8309909.1 tape measure protein [Sphingobacterium sp. InxBP1]
MADAVLSVEVRAKLDALARGLNSGGKTIESFVRKGDRNLSKIEQRLSTFGNSSRNIANNIKNSFGGITLNRFLQDISANKTALTDVKREAMAFAVELSKIDRQAFSGMNAGVKDLVKSFRTLNALASQFRNNSTSANGGASSLQQARLDAANYRTEIARLNRDLAALRLQQAQNRQGGQAAAGSYREAQQRLTALGQAIRNAAGGFDSSNPAVQRQIKAYRELNEQLKKFDAQMGNHQRNVGNYGSAFAGAIPYLGEFTSIAGVATMAIEGLKKSFTTNLKYEAVNQALKYTSGSSYEFSKNLQFLAKTSDRLGLDLLSTAQSFKMWQGAAKFSNLTADETRRIFESVANAGAKMKLSNDQVQGTFLALSQMLSKGKVQAEELRGQLGERLPGAFALAAKAMGVTEAQLNKMLETGQVVAGEFLPKFADQLDIAFSNDKVEKINSMQASTNRLSTEFDNLFKSDNASSFFTTIMDGLAGTIRGFNSLVSSGGWKGFFDKMNLLNPTTGSTTATMLGDNIGKWIGKSLGLDSYRDYSFNINRVRGTGAIESNPLAGLVPRSAFKGLDNRFGFGATDFQILPAKEIKNQSEELVKNKKYWEDQVKAITASRDALDSNQKGTKKWIELTAQLQKAQYNLDSYNDKKASSAAKKATNEAIKASKQRQQEQEKLSKLIIESNDSVQKKESTGLAKTRVEIDQKYAAWKRQALESVQFAGDAAETIKQLEINRAKETAVAVNDVVVGAYKKRYKEQLNAARELVENQRKSDADNISVDLIFSRRLDETASQRAVRQLNIQYKKLAEDLEKSLQSQKLGLGVDTGGDTRQLALQDELYEKMEQIHALDNKMRVDMVDGRNLFNGTLEKTNVLLDENARKYQAGSISLEQFKAVQSELLSQQEILTSLKTAYDQLTEGVGNAFANMLIGAESFSEGMESVFKQMVSTIISELARLAAVRFLGGIFSGGVTSLLGFASGGYTGNYGINQPAGIVHGQEFVVNARATKQFRPLLEGINSGKVPNINDFTPKIPKNISNLPSISSLNAKNNLSLSVDVNGQIQNNTIKLSGNRAVRREKKIGRG